MPERAIWLCIAGLAAIVLIPALLFPLPPVLDYPNHLARIWLIAGGVDIAPVNTFYYEDWREVGSGIGIDLLAKLLSPVVPPFTIGFFLLILAMLMPPLGAIALNAKVFGGLNAWQPFFLVFWCTQTLIAGFLNFQIGLGLAMLAVAAESRARGYWVWLLRAAVAMLLMLIHPYALFFYGVLLAATAIGHDVPTLREVPLRMKRAGIAASIVLLPLVVFFLRVGSVPGSDDKISKPAMFAEPFGVLRALVSPFSSYDIVVDFLFAVPLGALVIWGLARRRFDVHAGLFMVACAFLAFAMFMPTTFGHTGWIDKRFPLMALLAALAATRLDANPRQMAMLAGAALLVSMRTAWIAANWSAFAPLTDSMRQVLAEVPAGARVLAVQHDNTGREGAFHVLGRTTATLDETFRHYPALMIPWRHAFTPMMFAQHREKPILLRPDYARIANPTGGVMLSIHALHNFRMLDRRTQYIRKWRDNFDWLLVLNADRPDRYGPYKPPPELELVSDKGFAQLWRVRRTGD